MKDNDSSKSFPKPTAATTQLPLLSNNTSQSTATTQLSLEDGKSFSVSAGHITHHANDDESILGAKEPLAEEAIKSPPFFRPDAELEHQLDTEFIDDEVSGNEDDEYAMRYTRGKLKHYMILSEAGKSIYSRHGSDAYTSSVTGVLNTFLSTFQQAENELRCFQAGKTKFAFLTRKPLHLVAITRLPESDVQLQAQLDALYMQLLSALTLPNIERLFARNPAADLRRLLNGTEKLLSALADDLTRGSPSTLLSALESLRLKKDSRMAVNDTLLKQRSPSLLYGLIVAAGRLVSVVRPQKHSLYPGDLHLLFNMLFEAGSVRVGDGDNWIPICLPGFNRDGYLYLYVSSLYRVGGSGGDAGHRANQNNSNGITILLVSPHKEAFYELRDMRNQVEHHLERNGGLASILKAVAADRLSCSKCFPGTILRHFICRSRKHVQLVVSSYKPSFLSTTDRHRLLAVYQSLHSRVHGRPAPSKAVYILGPQYTGLCFRTDVLELYCIAPPSTSHSSASQAANEVLRWIRKEEENLFIIGGATF